MHVCSTCAALASLALADLVFNAFPLFSINITAARFSAWCVHKCNRCIVCTRMCIHVCTLCYITRSAVRLCNTPMHEYDDECVNTFFF